MTILLGYTPELRERQASQVRATPEPIPGGPGILQGIGTDFGAGAYEGFLDISRMAAILEGGLYARAGATEKADEIFESVNTYFPKKYEEISPDPMTVGAVGEFVRDMTRFLLPLGIPVVGTGVLAGNQAVNTAVDLFEQGVDADTAVTAGTAAGMAAAIGVKVPIFGRTRLGRAGLGAATNVALGAGQRGLTNEILEDQYPEVAAQYDAFNTRDILLDAAIGGVAGAVLPGAEGSGFRLPKLRKSERDALLTELNAQNARKGPQGSEPTSIAGENYLHDVKTAASDAIARGEPVRDLPRKPDNVDFVVTPRTVELHNAAREALSQFEIETGITPDVVPTPEEIGIRARVLSTVEQLADEQGVTDLEAVRNSLVDLEDIDTRLDLLEDEGVLERQEVAGAGPTVRIRNVQDDGLLSRSSEAQPVSVPKETVIQEATDELLVNQLAELEVTEPEIFESIRVETEAGGEVRETTLEDGEALVKDDVELLQQVAKCYAGGI